MLGERQSQGACTSGPQAVPAHFTQRNSTLQHCLVLIRLNGVALYVRECFDCIELNNCDDTVECLWVRMRGKANTADIPLGVCYRPPSQVEEVEETFYKQLADASQSVALVLVGELQFTARLLEIQHSREETV